MRRSPFGFKNLASLNLKKNSFNLSRSNACLYTEKAETKTIKAMNIKELMGTPMIWQKRFDKKDTYYITSDSKFQIKLGDFPDEALYRLVIDDKQSRQEFEFDDWPSCWQRIDNDSFPKLGI